MAMQARTIPLPEPRRVSPRLLSALLVIVGGVTIGGLAFVDPRYAVFAAVGIGLLMLFVVRAEWAVMTVIVARALINYIPRLARLQLPGLGGGGLEALVAGFLMVAAVVYLLAHRRPFFRAPLVIPFGIFLVAILATIATSQNRLITLEYWARMLSYFLVYVFVYDLARRSTKDRDLWWRFAIFLAAFIPVMAWASVAIEGHEAWRVLRSDVTRLQGPFGALEFGTLLMIPMILFTIQVIETRGTARRWYLFLLGITTASFLLSGSRSPWAGFVLATVVLGILRYRKLPVAVFFAGLTGLLVVPGMLKRITELIFTPQQTDLANRLAIWTESFNAFKAHPILGLGFGYGYWYAAYSLVGRAHATHSDYFRVLADAGIVGFTAFLIFLAAQGLHGLRVFRTAHDPLNQRIALVFIGSFVAYLVARATGNVLTHAEFNFQFWSLAGLVSALPALERGETGAGGA